MVTALATIDPAASLVVLRPADPADPVMVELAPTAERPWFTIVTASPGLKARDRRLLQLVVAVPPVWDESQRGDWTSRLLVATFAYGTTAALRAGDTIGNGEPPEPYAEDAPFVGAFLWPPVITPEHIDASDLAIDLLAVLPLHPAELALARRSGTSALLDGLDDHEVSELVTINRPSVA